MCANKLGSERSEFCRAITHDVTLPLTMIPLSVTNSAANQISLIVKDASRVTAAGGASAVPAGEASSASFPGGFGHQPAGTMTGTRGASL